MLERFNLCCGRGSGWTWQQPSGKAACIGATMPPLQRSQARRTWRLLNSSAKVSLVLQCSTTLWLTVPQCTQGAASLRVQFHKLAWCDADSGSGAMPSDPEGWRVGVWWPDDNQFYYGAVGTSDGGTPGHPSKHLVQYDDGGLDF